MQLSLLEAIKEGERLRDEGLARAVDKADRDCEKWSDRVYQLFKGWLKDKPTNYEFMTEDFRRQNKDLIDQPENLRAFGFICPKATREGLIRFVGNQKTKNSKSHRTPAGLWMKL